MNFIKINKKIIGFNTIRRWNIIRRWSQLNLDSRIIDYMKSMNFQQPNLIQKEVIPLILKRKDLVFISQTGTGKTLAYLIPMLQNLINSNSEINIKKIPSCIILVPTKDLIYQTNQLLKQAHPFIDFEISLDPLEMLHKNTLKKRIILITTPMLLINTKKLKIINQLSNLFLTCELLIIDELDSLLSRSYQDFCQIIIEQYIKYNKQNKQLIFTGACIHKDLLDDKNRYSIKSLIPNIEVFKSNKTHCLNSTLKLDFINVPLEVNEIEWKSNQLIQDIQFYLTKKLENKKSIILIFPNKLSCIDNYYKLLKDKFIHQNYSNIMVHKITKHETKEDRMKLMKSLTQDLNPYTHLVVSSDALAKGVDFPLLDLVIMVDFPTNAILFLHRCGRTARNNQHGKDKKLASKIELIYKNQNSLEEIFSKNRSFNRLMKAEEVLGHLKSLGIQN